MAEGEIESTVLVAGATGGVGSRVCAILLAKGVNVRCLARSEAKGRELVDELSGLVDKINQAGNKGCGSAEVMVGDVSDASTLTRNMFERVKAIVVCHAATVRPKPPEETDSEGSMTYRGMRYFEPELVSDPETVDFGGMKNILSAAQAWSDVGVNRCSDIELDACPVDDNAGPDAVCGLPNVVYVSSAYVTRPTRPELNMLQEPPVVRMNDMLGGILTWKKEAEDLIRESGLTYTVVRPCALTDGAGVIAVGAPERLEMGQGDEFRGKVSRSDVAALCVAALNCPEAAGKTFEVRRRKQDAAQPSEQSEMAQLSVLASEYFGWRSRFATLEADSEISA